MAYFTFDCENFIEDDYRVFAKMYGFSVKEPDEKCAEKKIVVDRLLVSSMKDIEKVLPDGYKLIAGKESDGRIQKTKENRNSEDCGPVEEALKENSLKAIEVLAGQIEKKVLTKRVVICNLIEKIEKKQKEENFELSDVTVIYERIPELSSIYCKRQSAKQRVQRYFDRIIMDKMKLSDIGNCFDFLYVKGLLELFHIM